MSAATGYQVKTDLRRPSLPDHHVSPAPAEASSPYPRDHSNGHYHPSAHPRYPEQQEHQRERPHPGRHLPNPPYVARGHPSHSSIAPAAPPPPAPPQYHHRPPPSHHHTSGDNLRTSPHTSQTTAGQTNRPLSAGDSKQSPLTSRSAAPYPPHHLHIQPPLSGPAPVHSPTSSQEPSRNSPLPRQLGVSPAGPFHDSVNTASLRSPSTVEYRNGPSPLGGGSSGAPAPYRSPGGTRVHPGHENGPMTDVKPPRSLSMSSHHQHPHSQSPAQLEYSRTYPPPPQPPQPHSQSPTHSHPQHPMHSQEVWRSPPDYGVAPDHHSAEPQRQHGVSHPHHHQQQQPPPQPPPPHSMAPPPPPGPPLHHHQPQSGPAHAQQDQRHPPAPPHPSHPQHQPAPPQHISPGAYGPPQPHPQPPPPSHVYDHPHYDGPSYGGLIPMGMQPNGAPRRKAIRASQACESCRIKKSKCDEGQPQCGNCVNNGIKCVYRAVPPPKQERSINALIEMVSALSDRVGHYQDRVDRIFNRLDNPSSNMSDSSPGLMNGQSGSQADASTIDRGRHMSNASGFMKEESHPGEPRQIWSQAMTRLHTPVQYGTWSAHPRSAVVEVDNLLAGQLSIPLDHSTAAHKILTSWPSIQHLWEGVVPSNYVGSLEVDRGVLKLFGRGEANDGVADPSQVNPPINREHEESNTPKSGDGYFGTGFNTPGPNEPRRIGTSDADGIPDKHFPLDEATVRRLWKSYQENIHTLHPFLDRRRVSKIMDDFIAKYSPTEPSPAASFVTSASSPHFPVRSDGNNAINRDLKRKRASEDGSANARQGRSGHPRIRPEHNMDNALLLLILALGRICEIRDHYPHAVTDEDIRQIEALHTSSLHSSPSFSGQSSKDGHQSPPGDSSRPFKQPKYGQGGQSPSLGGPTSGDRRPVSNITNMDKIPGLAYYAYAVGILGEMMGSNSLIKVQCCIIAGLFMGQLVRVVESFTWIHAAGHSCQILIQRSESTKTLPVRVRLAFWTCLQLESDILAELDLPQSGILRWEDQIPRARAEEVPAEDHEYLIWYEAQIYLRRELNKVHSALYNSSREKMRNVGWAALGAGDIADSVKRWRDGLPQALQWIDDWEAPQDINAARLRAKYWGAWYVIHRPFLQHAIRKEHDHVDDSKPVSVPSVHEDSPSQPPEAPPPEAPSMSPTNAASSEHTAQSDGIPQQKSNENVIDSAYVCVKAAIKSTIAFDNVPGRPIITNVFGTAHAQFGNCLVLSAVYLSKLHNWMISAKTLKDLLKRTINFLGKLAPASPTMSANHKVLINVAYNLFANDSGLESDELRSASSSFHA